MLSLLRFVFLTDPEFFRKELPNRLFNIMESVLYGSHHEYHDNIFFSNDGSVFVIKPDPLADFFVVRSLQQEKLRNFITTFAHLHPYNVSTNIISVLSFSNQISGVVYEILEHIWNTLNTRKGSEPEYIYTILLLTEIAHFNKAFLDLHKWNLPLWLSSFFEIVHKFQKRLLRIGIGRALFFIGNLFGQDGYFDKSSEALNALIHIYRKYHDIGLLLLTGGYKAEL